MYGVVALFDEKTEKEIRKIWRGLKEQSISDYAFQVIDRIPHVTLAGCSNINESAFMEKMEELYHSQRIIDISFNSIGSFMKSGTLFLSPVMTEELTMLHRKHHDAFREFDGSSASVYEPDKWVPHCTLANRLPFEKLAEAFRFCSAGIDVLSGAITEISLIKVHGDTAPVIYSVKLKP